MSYITDPANESYDFGHQFNYDVWTANTQLVMCNVPWNNDYRDTVWFDTDEQLEAYINSRSAENISISNVSYARVGEPITVNIPIGRAAQYNYIVAKNPAQPVPGNDAPQTFYYFITGVSRVAPNTTTITVELDVWQTYVRRVKFGRCYIERGHVGIAAENAFSNYGRDYLTIPEGLDTGSEMVTIAHRTETVMRAVNPEPGDITRLLDYDVMIVSTIDLTANYDVSEGLPIPKTPDGSGVQFMHSGAALYVIPAMTDTNNTDDINFAAWFAKFKDLATLTQGIVSTTLVPKISRYAAPGFKYNKTGPTELTNVIMRPRMTNMLPNWRAHADILNAIPARYRHLRKLFTSPYMVVEMTTSTGTSAILAPEAWNNDNARVMERAAYMPPDQRIAFYPRGYNALTKDVENLYDTTSGNWAALSGRGDGDDGGDYLGVFTQVSGFPQVPSVNDNAALSIANTRHGMAAARSSADWSQQKALAANNQSYDNTARLIDAGKVVDDWGRGAERDVMGIQNQTANDLAALDTFSDVVGSLGAGLTGGLAGAGMGLAGATANAIVGGARRGQQQASASQIMSVQHNAQVKQSNYMASANRSVAHSNRVLANSAAKGDYADTIAAMNAKVQDMQMTPPSMSGQFGGDTLNFIHDGLTLSLRWKMLDPGSMARVCEYWLRYGYSIQRFGTLPPKLACMSKFTYWKLAETYITEGKMPELFKQAIRGILEKGVTVWRNANDIGNTDPGTNTPLSGIRL